MDTLNCSSLVSLEYLYLNTNFERNTHDTLHPRNAIHQCYEIADDTVSLYLNNYNYTF